MKNITLLSLDFGLVLKYNLFFYINATVFKNKN